VRNTVIGTFCIISLVITMAVIVRSAQSQESGPKSVTITEAQLEKLVEQRMADAMIKEQRSLSKEVLQGKHWNRAIFDGVEYTIYTGPGDVVRVKYLGEPVEPLGVDGGPE